MFKQSLKRKISAFCKFQYKKGIVVLNYHSVGADNHYSLSIEKFAEQMVYLKNNYSFESLNNITKIINDNHLRVIVTFDDGFEDNYINVFPILKKYQIPATIFVTSDFVINGVDITKNWPDYGGLKPLTIGQIHEMEGSKLISFGSHGKSHSSMNGLCADKIMHELVASKQELDRVLIRPVVDFAFPFGQKKDRGLCTDKILKFAGYFTACTTDWGINDPGELNVYQLKRIRIDHNDSFNDFVEKIGGRWDFIKWFQRVRSLI